MAFPVDRCLDRQEKSGRALDFVERHHALQSVDESGGIALRRRQRGRIVQREITTRRGFFQRLRERAFARLPRAVDDDDRRIGQRFA